MRRLVPSWSFLTRLRRPLLFRLVGKEGGEKGRWVTVGYIYRYLRRGDLPCFSRKTHLRRRGKRKVNRSANYNTIQPDRTVLEWPAEIAQRTVIGHFEGDSVLGKPGTGGILTFVDRASRYLFAAKIDSKAAEPTRKAIVKLLKDVKVRSITLDNGCEFAQFRQIEEKLDTLVYFAEPHKPWQRGTNENTNGLLRFSSPKAVISVLFLKRPWILLSILSTLAPENASAGKLQKTFLRLLHLLDVPPGGTVKP